MSGRKRSAFLDGMARTFGVAPARRRRLSTEERLASALERGYAAMAAAGWRSSWAPRQPRMVLRDNAILANADVPCNVLVTGANVTIRNCRFTGAQS